MNSILELLMPYLDVCLYLILYGTNLCRQMYFTKKKKKRSPLVLNLSGPCGRASWWQMDWLSASAVCRLGALYSSLLGKTEPFFLPVDSCLLERLRKTSVACKGERQGKGERERKKKLTKALTNTISPKCSSSLPVVHCLQWKETW